MRDAEIMIICGESRPELLRHETLPEIFAATAHAHADRVALIDGTKSVTYGELHAAAARVAHHLLMAKVAAPGKIIGLWMSRGADLLIAQLGISMAGAAWLPFDADTPAARVAECAREAGASVVVSEPRLADALIQNAELTVLLAADLRAVVPTTALRSRSADLTPEHPAYVISTSGTTGKPKAIVISHRAICHFLRSENALLGIGPNDRVYQGFSVAFDMSFEEIWISYLAGAALWLAPSSVTIDPEAVALAIEKQRITVLHAVPSLVTLLPMLSPSLRLINLGGEACPQALADRIAVAGRRVVNTYGPTETTVSATLAELASGRAVTIGRPLPNYALAIVDPELNPVASGTPGELCVIGPGLAVGYRGLEQLTAERFPTGPFAGLPGVERLYRTGDLVQLDETGEVRFLGRLDDQLKVRGFRVEPGAIEEVLTAQPGVRAAAVVLRDDGNGDSLVAFVVLEESQDWAAELRRRLATALPAYLVPSRLIPLSELPRLTSGKVDRRHLRQQLLPQETGEKFIESPRTPAESALFAAVAAVLPGRAVRRSDNFFTDLGGHSLVAARLVSVLRSAHGFPRVSVREVYAHPRLEDLAVALAQGVDLTLAPTIIPLSVRDPGLRHRRWWCGVAQLFLLPIPVCLHLASWLAPFFAYHFFTGDEGDSPLEAAFLATLVFLFVQAASFALVVVVRRAIGRIGVGRYRLWGFTYLRWWFGGVMEQTASLYLLNGTPLYRLYLRLLGARIGRDVTIGSVAVAVPELLRVGDGAAIGSGVLIANARVAGGELIVGKVDIGEGALVDSYVVIEEGVRIGVDATVGSLSALRSGTQVADGEWWEGSPASCVGHGERISRQPPSSRWRRFGELLFYPITASLISAIFFLPVFPAFMLIDAIDAQWFDTFDERTHVALASLIYLALGLPAAAVLVLLTLLTAALLRAVICPSLGPGSWSIHSLHYYSKWIANQIQENSLHLLHGLFATVFAPWWFRLLGAKIGRGAEISTAMGVTPDQLTLGEDSFVADGAILGEEHVRGSVFSLIGTRIGNRTFIGNGACVLDGSDIPADVLIGVQTLAPPNEKLASGQTWMGSPAIGLPARETLTGYPESLTFRPSTMRRCARGAVELTRIVVPLAFIIAFGYIAVRLIMPLFEEERWVAGIAALTLAGFLYGVLSLVAVLAAKWVLIGRYRPRTAPMWTLFVWLSEAVTSIYESLAVPNFVKFLSGTPMLPSVLRCFGARIGRDTYLATTDLTEFDCVDIGDGAELNVGSGPQTHLFEDRVMKIGRIRIGVGATVGVGTTILYDSEVGDYVRLGPLTMVAKGERLPSGTAWEGSPASATRRDDSR